mgnify:CR=1 FL=1
MKSGNLIQESSHLALFNSQRLSELLDYSRILNTYFHSFCLLSPRPELELNFKIVNHFTQSCVLVKQM